MTQIINPNLREARENIQIVNPKDLVGSTKLDMTLIPGTALAHMALAAMNGDFKYIKYNWRDEDKKIKMSIYLGALMRHLVALSDGEDFASDSGIHHLGHIMQGAAILIDAWEHGQIIDDRVSGKSAQVIERLSKQYSTELLHKWQRTKDESVKKT